MPQGPFLLKPRLSKFITTTAYELKPSDWQYNALVLNAGAPTVITVPAGVVISDFTALMAALLGVRRRQLPA